MAIESEPLKLLCKRYLEKVLGVLALDVLVPLLIECLDQRLGVSNFLREQVVQHQVWSVVNHKGSLTILVGVPHYISGDN